MTNNTYLKTQKTARLTWVKSSDVHAKKLLIVLHGYGQLSTFFSRKFSKLQSNGYDILIPEGLHRFYLAGSAGRVGASWMTKEEREIDIQDNHAYLNEIIEMHGDAYEGISILGFSQGGATAARYYCENQDRFGFLILWASVFPPDIESLRTRLKGRNNYFVLGKQDEYFSTEKQKEVLNLHEELEMNVISFDGGHDIQKDILESILINI
ncbi:MAG: alpha/beta hydrolase [Crocinitomicaceae bacterium]|nr:alpha/beta hydrolase [Crocinitomicaceae bacterium]